MVLPCPGDFHRCESHPGQEPKARANLELEGGSGRDPQGPTNTSGSDI